MLKFEKKYLGILFLLLTLVMCIYFGQYLFNNIPLQYGTDLRPQWFLFYEEFRDLMHSVISSNSLPFYSWSNFLGTNFFASKSYYVMGDFFSYIGLLFRTDFFTTALLLELLKFYVAGFAMYLLLSTYQIKPLIKIIGSLCFTFSGWAIFFSGQLTFLSFYAIVPLYFVGIEYYLQKKNGVLFIIMSALCLFTNFYFFFTLSFFTVIYVLYRYHLLRENYKNFLKEISILIMYYLIGVLITMILTLPTIYYILDIDRLGGYYEGLFFSEKQTYFHELISMFIPNYLYIYGNNIYETSIHYTREIAIYSGLINIILLPSIFTFKNKFKSATICVWFVFLLLLIFPRLDSIIHGFGDPSFRWTFFFILFNIITTCTLLNQLESLNMKTIRNSCLCMSVFVFLAIPFTTAALGKNFSEFIPQFTLFVIFSILIIIYLIIILAKTKYTLLMILCLSVLEISGSGYQLFNDKISISQDQNRQFINSVTHVLQDYDNELNNILDSIESENSSQYYRVFVPHSSLYWEYSHNMSMIYQLNGTMTYDSTYAPSINDLKHLEPTIRDFESDWIFNIKDIHLLEFLNVKYAIVTHEDELPSGGKWIPITKYFRSSFLIYRNENYRSLGTTYHELQLITNYTNAASLTKTLYVDEKDYDVIQSTLLSTLTSNLENINYSNNQLTGTCFSDDQSFMVVTLPFDKGWTIYVNDSKVDTFKVNGGFIGFPISKGENSITMQFTPQGFKIGALLSVLGVLIFLTYTGLVIKKKKYTVR